MNKQSVDLTQTQLAVIESALETQEKILSVQNRAGSSPAARIKLSELKAVKRILQRTSGTEKRSWASRAKSLIWGVGGFA